MLAPAPVTAGDEYELTPALALLLLLLVLLLLVVEVVVMLVLLKFELEIAPPGAAVPNAADDWDTKGTATGRGGAGLPDEELPMRLLLPPVGKTEEDDGPKTVAVAASAGLAEV